MFSGVRCCCCDVCNYTVAQCANIMRFGSLRIHLHKAIVWAFGKQAALTNLWAKTNEMFVCFIFPIKRSHRKIPVDARGVFLFTRSESLVFMQWEICISHAVMPDHKNVICLLWVIIICVSNDKCAMFLFVHFCSLSHQFSFAFFVRVCVCARASRTAYAFYFVEHAIVAVWLCFPNAKTSTECQRVILFEVVQLLC